MFVTIEKFTFYKLKKVYKEEQCTDFHPLLRRLIVDIVVIVVLDR